MSDEVGCLVGWLSFLYCLGWHGAPKVKAQAFWCLERVVVHGFMFGFGIALHCIASHRGWELGHGLTPGISSLGFCVVSIHEIPRTLVVPVLLPITTPFVGSDESVSRS